ncbi:unnamed protein product [Amoebophrya sp. A25]|nr:unnamed protein product [Amoebophrya sp. A25]|eukprot:GSA25T00000147001.1
MVEVGLFVRECCMYFEQLGEADREKLLQRLESIHLDKKIKENNDASGSKMNGAATAPGPGGGGSSSSSSAYSAPSLLGHGNIVSFMSEEEGSSLLTRNDCVNGENYDTYCKKVRTWLSLIAPDIERRQIDKAAIAAGTYRDLTQDQMGAFERIFRRDADRTVLLEHRRLRFIETCRLVFHDVRDYHQGGGFITAFLSFFLPDEEVVKIMWHLNREEMKGYFKGAAQGFVADSRVFHVLMQQFVPDITAHMEKHKMNAENMQMWCIKFFTGLGVHFMPFSCLFTYMEACLTHGSVFFFKFGIAWLQFLETHLMLCKSTSELQTLLRNDHPTDHCKSHPALFKNAAEESAIFEEIIAKAHQVDLNKFGDFDALRKQVATEFEEIMEARRQRMQELAAEVDNCDDDFSDEED